MLRPEMALGMLMVRYNPRTHQLTHHQKGMGIKVAVLTLPTRVLSGAGGPLIQGIRQHGETSCLRLEEPLMQYG